MRYSEPCLTEVEARAVVAQVHQVFGEGVDEAEEDEMGLVDTLVQSGFQPEVNQDSQFEVLAGQYRCSWMVLRPEAEDTAKNRPARWAAQFVIEEALEGTHVNIDLAPEKRRRFFKSYTKDADGAKKLLNDLFTVGVELDTSSDEAFEASFDRAIGKPVFIRSWGWTPEQTRDGQAIPVAQRRTMQQLVIKREQDVKIKQGAAAAGGPTPF